MKLPMGRNNFLGESANTRLKGTKGTEGHISKKRLLSPITKAPFQNNCH